MVNLRFFKRYIKRGFLYVLVALGFYYLQLVIISNNSLGRKMVTDVKEKPKELPVAVANQLKNREEDFALKDYERLPPVGNNSAVTNDMVFDKKDMVDEHGDTYKIGIWVANRAKPGYLANQQECLGNVYCDISFTQDNNKHFHAIVFKSDNLHDGIPTSRYPKQLFAWWTGESPLHTSLPPIHLDDKFNLTFHYRTDADVYAPYGSINLILRELKKAGEVELDDLLQKKRRSGKMAAWAVSNCYGKRMEYAKSLINAGLAVDTFGSCFEHRQLGQGSYSDSMYEQLSEYKFYFAFENSITCKDYFTEKFWFNGLRSGAVPIVWGPSKNDLLKVVPSKSFIHAEDFSTPEELVEYLNYLAKNETVYSEYLQWRTWVKHPERAEERLKMENRDNDMRSYCKLCSILQADGRRRKLGFPNPPRIIPSIKKAWKDPDIACHR